MKRNNNERFLVTFLAILIVFSIFPAIPVSAQTGTILAGPFTPTGPTGNGRGMAFDGTDLYYTIVGDSNIYKIDTSGALLATISVPSLDPRISAGGPLAWDGSALWTMDYGLSSFTLYQVDPLTGATLSSCNIATQNPAHPAVTGSPNNIGRQPDGLAWSGISLWVSEEISLSPDLNWVVEVDTSCNILSSFNPPLINGIGASGIAFDGVNLWHSNAHMEQYQTDVFGVQTGLSFQNNLQLEDLAFDSTTFAPKCALWSNQAVSAGNQITAYEVPCPEEPVTILPPTVDKTVDPPDIYFGGDQKTTTVTIEVNGAGGTSTTTTPMDVVFAIDSSGSMSSNDPGNLRLSAAKDFVDKMDSSRDQGGVVSWDQQLPPTWPTGIDFTFGLSNDFDDIDGLKYWIDQVDAAGGTDLNLGLDTAITMLDANTRVDPSVEVIIFLTDGRGSYTFSGNPGSPADNAASKGYIIYSIGLGAGHLPMPLQDMATTTGGAYFNAPSADNLQAIFDAIFTEVVTSTVPHYVNVTEVTQDYIVGHTNFNILPDSITTNLDGTTTLFWENIGLYADGDPDFGADETVTLTFDVWSTLLGTDLPVEVEHEAIVEYADKDGNYIGFVDIPQATINVYPFVTDLIAGGGNPKSAIDVGDVIIWNDLDYLYITYTTTGDWFMSETHLHVADSFDGIPQTKKGNPIPGHFDYINYFDPGVQTFTVSIPWIWESGTTLYIAAHAAVSWGETAWGNGINFNDKNWATYIIYQDP